MKRVLLPHLIRLCRQATHIARQTSIESPEVARGDAGNPHGALSLRSSSSTVSSDTHMPAAASARDCSISWSRRPLAASAFICRSQSSSTVGCSIAISSQYSRGLRDSMAAFISVMVVMLLAYHSAPTPNNANPWLVSPSISSTLLSGERIPASPIRRQSATERRCRDGAEMSTGSVMMLSIPAVRCGNKGKGARTSCQPPKMEKLASCPDLVAGTIFLFDRFQAGTNENGPGTLRCPARL